MTPCDETPTCTLPCSIQTLTPFSESNRMLIPGRVTTLLGLATLALIVGLPFDVLAHGISEADRQRMLGGGYLQYVGLGASHMLTGYDHLLFLFRGFSF